MSKTFTDVTTLKALRAFDARAGYSKFERMRDALEAVVDDIRLDTANEIISELERCALVLATENDEVGNYLVAAVLQKAVDIVKTTMEGADASQV